MVKVKIDFAKCGEGADKICLEICPVSVFREKKTGRPEIVNEENCIMCRSCQVNCPSQAIEILT